MSLQKSEAEFQNDALLAGEVFREPLDGSNRYLPYGAMPGDPYLGDEIESRQLEIDIEFKKLFLSPDTDAPPAFRQMLVADFEVGRQRRKLLNFDGYMKWKALEEVMEPRVEVLSQLVERGTADCAEAIDFALNTEIEKTEIGQLTCAYSNRLEHVQPFREEVAAAIEAHGGVLIPSIIPYRGLSIVPDVEYLEDGFHTLNGFIIRYKRDVGYIRLPNDEGVLRIVERQIAGVRIDEDSGFSDPVLKMMQYTPIAGDHTWQDNEKQYLHDTGCQSFIEQAVQADTVEALIVPISVTVYAYKEAHDVEACRTVGGVALRRPVYDDGIAYFGPEFSRATQPDGLLDIFLHKPPSSQDL